MIYVIDHNDSFTHNVVHQFSLFDKVECDNYNNVNRLKLRQAKVIIFSPGPGNPKNYPSTSEIYHRYKGKKKIIGVYFCASWCPPCKAFTTELIKFYKEMQKKESCV